MKRFAIFRKGKHTASSGLTAEYTAEQLRAAVAAYDPNISPAPIVVGHPKDNHPAFGWIGSLEFDEGAGEVLAVPEKVMPAFNEAVAAGHYRTRSASWYLPGSAAHPLKGTDKHGTLYPRHVGFLGAQPPAIKGLGDVQFSAADDGIVEFTDAEGWAWGSLANIMRGLREWLIGEKGLDTADKVLPNYFLSDLDAAAKEARDTPDTNQAGAMPAFAEGSAMPTVQELQAQIAAKDTEIATLKAKQMPADFAERETSLAAREAAVRAAEAKAARATIEARIDAVIKAGKALPAARKGLVDFAMSLADADAVVDFGEGDKAKKVTQREHYLLQMESGPKLVDYSEHSGDDGQDGDSRPPISEVQAGLRNQVFGGGAPAQK